MLRCLARSGTALALLCGAAPAAMPAEFDWHMVVEPPAPAPAVQPSETPRHHQAPREHRYGDARREPRPEPHSGAVASHAARPEGELATLRKMLAQKLKALNAPLPLTPPPTGNAATFAVPVVATRRPACPPAFDMRDWMGRGRFADRITILRKSAAISREAPAAMAALAEAHLGEGLAAEALAVIA